MFYYIDLNGTIESYYSNREDAVASFQSLHASLPVYGGDAYGLHHYDGKQDDLLTCSEAEWDADWEAAHPEYWE